MINTGRRNGWPWGPNHPTLDRRVLLATSIAIACSLWVLYGPNVGNSWHTDFGQIWFAARAMLQGRNPYPLIGPGREFEWDWVTNYPATAFVLAVPLASLSERIASAIFVALSAWLAVFGATRDSWHRLPAFASAAFVIALRAGQWSPLLSAAWFIPALAFAWPAKPTTGLALFAASPSNTHRKIAVFSGLLLGLISLIALPGWPRDWLKAIAESGHVVPPIVQPGGFLIGLALLRWKTREAWVVIAMALAPQTPSIYDALPILLLIPRTYHESCLLSLASSFGGLLMLIVPQTDAAQFIHWRGALLVATTYLPAVAMILRRPNLGHSEFPAPEPHERRFFP